MARVAEDLMAQLSRQGYPARVISFDCVASLEEQIADLHATGAFDEAFFHDRLAWFRFQPPESLPHARSVIVAAVPRPQTRAVFTRESRRRALILPPTYTAYDRTQEQFEGVVAELLSRDGFSRARTMLPLKPLAVRSGLGEYGRNNLCYVPGMGSFLQLVAVYSDLPCEETGWRDPVRMEQCEGCDLCQRACPTGAIAADRFLLHGARCLVYHNEKPGAVPFPAWLAASWHNCVVGCMHCQRVCPLNQEFLGWVGAEEEFSEAETTALLTGGSAESLPASAFTKLQRLSLDEYLDSLPRNLAVFFPSPRSTR